MAEIQTLVKEKPKPLRCIVKLGGAAITRKNELEAINEENLRSVCRRLSEAMTPAMRVSSPRIVGMDWSRRRDGEMEVLNFGGFGEDSAVDLDNNFILVHGAGLFGHFQASRSGVHKGGLQNAIVKAGFVATRISFASADVSKIDKALCAGSRALQVLHGDAVLDNMLECTILSGNVIICHLAQLLMPECSNHPPADPNAVLLREIAVDDDGSWAIVKPTVERLKEGVEISVAAHDTTGGMETKILEAAGIAKLGINVYITKVGTDHSLRALKGEVSMVPDDWLGTVIRSSKKNCPS